MSSEEESLDNTEASPSEGTPTLPEDETKEESTSPVPDDFSQILTKVKEINPDNDEDALELAKVVAIEIKEKCQSVDSLTSLLHQLHEESLKSESTGHKTAILFSCLSQLEVDGIKCRNLFLRKIQEDFSQDSDFFDSNLVAFLCQVFRRVRVADGTTISALTGPIMTCLDKALDQKEEKEEESVLLLFSKQLQVLGPELRLAQAEKFEELLSKLRLKIAQPISVRKEVMCSLLIVLELAASKDWRLSDVSKTFYDENLEPGILQEAMEVSKPPEVMQQPNLSDSMASLSMASRFNLPDMSVPPPNMKFHHTRPRFRQPLHHQQQPQQQFQSFAGSHGQPHFQQRNSYHNRPDRRGSGGRFGEWNSSAGMKPFHQGHQSPIGAFGGEIDEWGSERGNRVGGGGGGGGGGGSWSSNGRGGSTVSPSIGEWSEGNNVSSPHQQGWGGGSGGGGGGNEWNGSLSPTSNAQWSTGTTKQPDWSNGAASRASPISGSNSAWNQMKIDDWGSGGNPIRSPSPPLAAVDNNAGSMSGWGKPASGWGAENVSGAPGGGSDWSTATDEASFKVSNSWSAADGSDSAPSGPSGWGDSTFPTNNMNGSSWK